MNHWKDRTELPAKRLLGWLGLREGKFYDWTDRYGKENSHNGKIPRDWWLEDWEKQAILDYHRQHPDEGYRRLTYMMLDADLVAVSPATVYRVLSQAGRRWAKPSKKGTGFVQRTSPGYPQSNGKLERWHGTIKSECIRPGTPLSLDDARRLVTRWVEHYNTVRLHSAIGYVTPADQLAGRQATIFAQPALATYDG